jgi:invasion protein IalB
MLRKVLILALIAALPLTATSVLAQSRAKSPAPAKGPEAGKVFSDWVIDCEQAPDGKQQCFASQTQTMQQPGQQQGQSQTGRLLKLSVGYIGAGGKPAMVAILPLGLYLPAGVAYQVEGQEQKPMVLQRCLAEGCIAAAELDEAVLGHMRKGKNLNVGFKGDANGQTLVIPVSLKGFDPAVRSIK